MHECLTESTDIGRIEELLRARSSKAQRGVVTVDGDHPPSVFRHRILLAWDYSLLRRRRTRQPAASPHRLAQRAMAEDVLRTETCPRCSPPDAVEKCRGRGKRAVRWRTGARNRDELYEIDSAPHGALATGALEEAASPARLIRCYPRWSAKVRVVRARFSIGRARNAYRE